MRRPIPFPIVARPRRVAFGPPAAAALTLALALAMALAGCGAPPAERAGRDAGVPAAPEVVHRPAPAPAELSITERYYAAYLADTVDGDRVAARAGYEAVLEQAGADDAELAARAALRLAELNALEGRRREALDLVARATSLGGDAPELVEAADALRLRLAAAAGPTIETRGPPAGAPIEGASADAGERFRKAERLLVAYLGLRVRPRLENFYDVVRRKEAALDAAVRAYRHVAEGGEPVAIAAAEFRIASLYHDYALATLAFEVPPELTTEYATQMRRELRRSATRYFRLAEQAYAASLAAAPDVPGAALWHAAARRGASTVEQILRQAR